MYSLGKIQFFVGINQMLQVRTGYCQKNLQLSLENTGPGREKISVPMPVVSDRVEVMAPL